MSNAFPWLTGPVVVKEPAAVRVRLRELGIPGELIEEVRLSWKGQAATATDFEPITAPGTKGWIAGIGTLREGLALTKPSWEPVNRRNWPLSISPTKDFAVTVTSGDEHTGLDLPGCRPRTKNPKGLVVAEAVRHNAETLDLFEARFLQRTDGKPRRVKSAPLTYLLLIFGTATKARINAPVEWRAELSLPRTIVKRQIVSWAERILLPAIKDDFVPSARKPKPGDEGPRIDVPVNWKR